MATLGSARVIGMDEEIGAITPGRRADIVAIRPVPGADVESDPAAAALDARATVAWSFVGLRKGAGYQQDVQKLNPVHVIIAGLIGAYLLGKRVGYGKDSMAPHSLTMTMIGASLLWFGWFGFNAGSELAADVYASLAFINTIVAPAAALLAWIVVEKIKDGKSTSVGAASGAVAGLVAITPACASLTPGWAIVLGILAGALCALAVELKFKLGFDDSLDVVGIHLVGGLIGTLFLGFFATGTGLLESGSFAQLGAQAIGAFAVLIYSFVLAFVIGFIIEKTIGFRVKNEDEIAGVDLVVHGEEGYVLDAK